MNQTSFVDTRSRSTDPISSRLAARAAAGGKAGELRRMIRRELWKTPHGMTAKQLAVSLNVDYYAIQRRLSETAGIRKTNRMCDGAMVWEFAC